MITAILLAAGSSRRMGKANKLLLPFGQTTVVERVLDTLLEVKGLEIIVVLGHEATQIQQLLEQRPVKMVVNEKHLMGMTTSIQAGVQASSFHSTGYMICLADLPLIGAEEYREVVQVFEKRIEQQPKSILIPTHQKKKGHPVIFAQQYRSAILEHPEMEGCKKIIQQNSQHLRFLELSNPHILQDMDTPKDYEHLRNKDF